VLRDFGRAVLGAMPAKRAFLRAAGRLPPNLRSRTSLRVCSAVARLSATDGEVSSSNLGISRRLRCDVPASHAVARFGAPELYAGERGALDLARQLSRHSDAFVDIGAHTGIFSFYVRSNAPSEVPVYFFEPDPVLFKRLAHNVAANSLPNCRGFNEAIGAVDGRAAFYRKTADSLSGSLLRDFSDQQEDAAIDVPVSTFACVAARLQLSHACVKVDIEGAEQAFLDGAGASLQHVSFLIMEVLGPAVRRGFVSELMRRTGLRAYYINDYVLEPSLDGSFTYCEPEYNWLFCRETPADLAALLSPRMRVRQ